MLGLTNAGLTRLNQALGWANEHFPETTKWVLGGVGAFLALAAALGVIGFAWPAVAAAFSLLGSLLSPVGGLWTGLRFVAFGIASLAGISVGAVAAIGALAVVLTAAAIDIYEHWDRFAGFFRSMWLGVENVFAGFGNFLLGVFTHDIDRAVAGIDQAFGGLVQFFTGLFGTIRQLFVDFSNWVDGWSGGLASKITGTFSNSIHEQLGWLGGLADRLGIGGVLHNVATNVGSVLGGSGGSPIAGAQHSLTVTVHADPGTRVTAVSSTPGVTVQNAAPNRGPTVTRP